MSETQERRVREALARNRDRPSINLSFDFPINWQIDLELSETLAKDLKTHGAAWEILRATPDLASSIPPKHGVYMFVYRSHLKLQVADQSAHPLDHPITWVLYVGRAGSSASERTLRDRYKTEYCKYITGEIENLWSDHPNNQRTAKLKKYLNLWPLEYWFLTIEDRNTIEGLENRLIKLFAPPLNSNSKLSVTKGVPKPAFKEP